MKIIVCAKQVPNTNEVKIDPVKGTLIRDGVESILNPDDANALEAALTLKDHLENCTVTVVSMGPAQADDMLRECLAMGADDAVLICGREFAGADTWSTANTIATAIRYLGDFDLVFAGRQAIDGDTAQVGPQIAERLGIPQITYVEDCQISGNTVTVRRQLEDGYQIVQTQMPCLLTAVKELNTPRYMSVRGIYEAYEKEIRVISFDDLPLTLEQVGLEASPTQVFKSFTPEPKGKGVVYSGSPKEQVGALMSALREKHIV